MFLCGFCPVGAPALVSLNDRLTCKMKLTLFPPWMCIAVLYHNSRKQIRHKLFFLHSNPSQAFYHGRVGWYIMARSLWEVGPCPFFLSRGYIIHVFSCSRHRIQREREKKDRKRNNNNNKNQSPNCNVTEIQEGTC